VPFSSVKQKELFKAYSKSWTSRPIERLAEPSCLDEIVRLNDGTKHDGMATLFSQFHLLMISVFTTVE